MSALIRIATRGSALALWQANWVRDRLMADDPHLTVELLVLKTRGDKILDRALSEVGGKGLFVKEIEEALLDGRAEVAVHSMKDLPADIPVGLVLGAVPAREDARDALLVAPKLLARDVASLPHGARVGTSSLRRVCQLKARRPDVEIVPLRGNVDTRVRKVDAGELDAIVLACAGLKRLGHGARITAALSTGESLPAIGQGALAIECRGDDAETLARLARLDDRTTAHAVTAERAFLRRLQGDCKTPLAAHAVVDGARLTIEGLVGAPDGSKLLRHALEGTTEDAGTVGHALAEELLRQGADELLAFSTTELVGGE
ncbi:MAG: hydroxymethylbilane synthase [Myxococcales bacterium]|nr:hydroxymethylbilane synthase [Myxococcales bacterium]